MSSEIRVPEAQSPIAASEPVQAVPPAPQIADPAPLGLAGFAMTTFVLSVFNTGMINGSVSAVVLPLALFYGGTVQLLAGMWEFRRGNTFGAVAFSSYGAFWLAFAAYVKFVAPGLGADAGDATGLFLLSWGFFTLYMTFAALRTSGAIVAVFITLTGTYALLAIGAFTNSTNTNHAGGGLGILCAVCAWYAAFAGVTNGTWGRTVIPTWPLNNFQPKARRHVTARPATSAAH